MIDLFLVTCILFDISAKKQSKPMDEIRRPPHRIVAPKQVWIVSDGVLHSRDFNPSKVGLSGDQIRANEKIVDEWIKKGLHLSENR